MLIYISMCIYIYIYICLYIALHCSAPGSAEIHTSIRPYICTFLLIHKDIRTFTHSCVHKSKHPYIHTP